MKKPVNGSDPQAVKERNRKIENARDEQLKDLRELLALPAFRKFVWRYLGRARVFETSFTGNSTTFFNEGVRQVALWLLADITEAQPEAFIQMQKEAKQGEM